jgi:hypothetical protein
VSSGAAGPRGRAGRRGRGALLLLATACANIQPPPGGPRDVEPPRLVGTFPESVAVLPGFKGNVEFRFSEVISEGSSPNLGLGTGDLEKLIILSPTDRVPDVGWHRHRITVRPAEGWKPNRVYRVELLPGVTDVRRNRAQKAEAVVTFTTGAPVPKAGLSGVVYDWKAGRPAPGALVEAVLQPDSLPYRALTDSSGRFRLAPLPEGEYLVFGVLDQNRNLRRDPREAWDSVRARADTGEVPALYAFVHDSLPPRIQSIAALDSATAALTFSQPLDPRQRLDTAAVTVRRLPDSTRVPVRAVALRSETAPSPGPEAPAAPAPAAPAPAAPAPAPPPPAAPPKDTLGKRAEAPPGPAARPPLTDQLTVTVAEPWHDGDRLLFDIQGIRSVSGIQADARGTMVVGQPKTAGPQGPAGKDAGRVRSPADSARARLQQVADSLRADSLKRRRPQ